MVVPQLISPVAILWSCSARLRQQQGTSYTIWTCLIGDGLVGWLGWTQTARLSMFINICKRAKVHFQKGTSALACPISHQSARCWKYFHMIAQGVLLMCFKRPYNYHQTLEPLWICNVGDCKWSAPEENCHVCSLRFVYCCFIFVLAGSKFSRPIGTDPLAVQNPLFTMFQAYIESRSIQGLVSLSIILVSIIPESIFPTSIIPASESLVQIHLDPGSMH